MFLFLHGLSDVFDHLANAGVLDAVLPAVRVTDASNDVVLVALVAGIHVDGHEREADRRALAQDVEDL